MTNPIETPEAVDTDQLFERIMRLRDMYATRKANDELLDKLYAMVMDEPDTNTSEMVVSSRPFDAINMATDMLTTNSPVWEVVPVDDSENGRREASAVERWFEAVFYNAERYSSRPLMQAVTHHAFLYGRYCVRALLLKKPRKGQTPFRIQVRDPRYVYPLFDEDGHLYAIGEVFDRTWGDVARAYPDFHPQKDGHNVPDPLSDDSVEWAEYWDDERFAIFVDGECVETGEHKLGVLPYVWRYGRFRPSDDPNNEALSLLEGVKFTAPMYNLLMSAKATAIRQYVQGVIVRYSDHRDPIELDMTPGAQNQIFTDERVEWFRPQGVMPEMEGMLNLIRTELQDSTFKTLVGDSTATSGYAISQVQRSERNKINPVRLNLEWGMGELGQLLLQLAIKYGKEIDVVPPARAGVPSYLRRQASMTPEIAKHYDQVFCRIPPDYLEDKVQTMSLAIQAGAGAKPLLDQETIRREILHVPDPQQVEENVWRERLLEMTANPQMPNNWPQYIMKRVGQVQENMPQQGMGGPEEQGEPAGQQVQPNSGMPPSTPAALQNAQRMPPGMMGIPPTPERALLDRAVGGAIGQGMMPDEQMQRMQGMGTPQVRGR